MARNYSVTILQDCRAGGKNLSKGDSWEYDADNPRDLDILRALAAANRVAPTPEEWEKITNKEPRAGLFSGKKSKE